MKRAAALIVVPLVFVSMLVPAGPGPSAAPEPPAPAGAHAGPDAAAQAELPAEPTDARTLLRALATIGGLEARFVERKHLALLRAPLVSEGRLYYTRPGHLARFVETPSPSTVRIGPTDLVVHDDSGTQRFDLRSRPEIKTFVESFVHVVAGDYEALASTYTLDFVPASTPGAVWLLRLVPVGRPLSDLVDRLEIRGQGYHVSTIHVLEHNGDSTEIVLSQVDPRRAFTEQERRRLFGLPPSEHAG